MERKLKGKISRASAIEYKANLPLLFFRVTAGLVGESWKKICRSGILACVCVMKSKLLCWPTYNFISDFVRQNCQPRQREAASWHLRKTGGAGTLSLDCPAAAFGRFCVFAARKAIEKQDVAEVVSQRRSHNILATHSRNLLEKVFRCTWRRLTYSSETVATVRTKRCETLCLFEYKASYKVPSYSGIAWVTEFVWV